MTHVSHDSTPSRQIRRRADASSTDVAGTTLPYRRLQGASVLSHPIVVVGIAIWILNDHVLKSAYGSWWTGKLTDIVALVVFPLLVATALERLTERPLQLAIGFTTIFYSAINLWAPADAATEWVMSLVIDSRLTLDPTDLVVMPAMAGAWWLWHRAAHSPTRRRRAWGRTIFMIGLATTVATSPDFATSETFQGTVLLTGDQPTVVFPFSLTIDGKPATSVSAMYPRVEYTSFAMSPPAAIGYGSVSIVADLTSDGEGEITIELEEMQLAPVEVTWTVEAETEDDGGWLGVFGSSDPPEPVLDVQAPANQSGPEPRDVLAFASTSRDDPVQAWEWKVTVPAGDDPADQQIALSLASGGWAPYIEVGTSDGPIQLKPGVLTPVAKPESCDAVAECSFSIWVASATMRIDAELGLYGPPDMIVHDLVALDVVRSIKRLRTPLVSSDVPTTTIFPATLSLPEPSAPGDQQAMFFRIIGSIDYPNLDPEDDVPIDEGLRGSIGLTMGAGSVYEPQRVSRCCEPMFVELSLRAQDDSNGEGATVIVGEIEIEVWSLTQRSSSEIEFVFTE